MIYPWGCKPSYSPRKARLARKYKEGVNPFTSPSKTLRNKIFQDKSDGYGGVVNPYIPQEV
jgi:hypothetical protein